MASLIEQAATRLEQLRKAGVEIPDLAIQDAVLASPGPDNEGASSEPARKPRAVSKRVDLDLARLEAAGFVTPQVRRSATAEQYRMIKRPLIRNAMRRGAGAAGHSNLIMITSAVAGEGKSFTALNLAMSIATELDHTVMLIDADVARPSLPRMLGIEPSQGLLDLLEDRVEMSDVLLRTNVDKLTFLPSGNSHPRATELLASEAMRRLLEDIATYYSDRIVLFDSPPLLLTTEARVLASQMGQVVVVVQADRTVQAGVQHALAMVESCPVRLALLNRAQSGADTSYYYEYEGYGGYDRTSQTAALSS